MSIKMDWEVQVVNDARTNEQTILLRFTFGGVNILVNLLPRDAAQVAKTMGEAARVATTGVILPTAEETGRIIN